MFVFFGKLLTSVSIGGRVDGRGSFCVCWQAFEEEVQERSISDSFWRNNQFLSSFFRTPT
jgi:hypothetical protein